MKQKNAFKKINKNKMKLIKLTKVTKIKIDKIQNTIIRIEMGYHCKSCFLALWKVTLLRWKHK